MEELRASLGPNFLYPQKIAVWLSKDVLYEEEKIVKFFLCTKVLQQGVKASTMQRKHRVLLLETSCHFSACLGRWLDHWPCRGNLTLLMNPFCEQT